MFCEILLTPTGIKIEVPAAAVLVLALLPLGLVPRWQRVFFEVDFRNNRRISRLQREVDRTRRGCAGHRVIDQSAKTMRIIAGSRSSGRVAGSEGGIGAVEDSVWGTGIIEVIAGSRCGDEAA
jgi:hypothetical protein